MVIDEAVKHILQLYKEGKKEISDRYDQDVKVTEKNLSGNSVEEVVFSQNHTQFRTESIEIEHDNLDVKNIEVILRYFYHPFYLFLVVIEMI